jgi:hypothetical protein
MKAPRLPIILITGSDENAKHQLVSRWMNLANQRTQVWQYISNTDDSFNLSGSGQGMVRLQACLCCSGKVALASTVVRLLREHRRHPKALNGMLMTVSPAADIALLLEHFLQPLLVRLVTVVKVVCYGKDQLQDIQNIDLALDLQSPELERELTHLSTDLNAIRPAWALAHFPAAHFWPPETVFDRTSVVTFFSTLLGAPWTIDAVLRTDRDWYGFSMKDGQLKTQVSKLRRGSYLNVVSRPSQSPYTSDAWLISQLNVSARSTY